MKERVIEVLDAIRPGLMADGGDVEFVEITKGIVKLRLTGACHGCPMSAYTLKVGIESAIRHSVPEILEVVAI
ncbi:MAG: NifU family protein [Armatimonadetes bacterium]|nr:NifU family protein [Armatimonadota bacterium]